MPLNEDWKWSFNPNVKFANSAKPADNSGISNSHYAISTDHYRTYEIGHIHQVAAWDPSGLVGLMVGTCSVCGARVTCHAFPADSISEVHVQLVKVVDAILAQGSKIDGGTLLAFAEVVESLTEIEESLKVSMALVEMMKQRVADAATGELEEEA